MGAPGSGLRISVELDPGQIEAIARRAAEIVSATESRSDGRGPYLSVREAADYLRCSRQRVYDLLSQGALTRLKDGTRVLVARAEVDAYLAGVPTGRLARRSQAGRNGPNLQTPDLAPQRDVPSLFPPGAFSTARRARKTTKNPA
jgi:excisionase family DNA binding protein